MIDEATQARISEAFDDPNFPRRRKFFVRAPVRDWTSEQVLSLLGIPRLGDEHPRCVSMGKPLRCRELRVEWATPKWAWVACEYEAEYDLDRAYAALNANEERIHNELRERFGLDIGEARTLFGRFMLVVNNLKADDLIVDARRIASTAKAACGQEATTPDGGGSSREVDANLPRRAPAFLQLSVCRVGR
jgi:hypothetical protein